jgi:hypothetical protein
MKTTLKKIRACSPCSDGWTKLLSNLGKTKADDEPLAITTILDSNGLNDALWCLRAVDGHQREMRLFAVDCARSVQHLMIDQRSLAAINVAERHADGLATDSELDAAWDAAWDAARDAAWDAASGAARGAAWGAARGAAWDAASGAARGAAWGAARGAVMASACAAVCDAARGAQADLLRIVCAEIEQREEL